MATFPIFYPPPERRDSAMTSTVTAISPASPAKRVKDMTAEERLASLKEWAEQQKYIQPGQGGTFGYGGLGVSRPVAYSGPVRYVAPSYTGYIAPPSYETAAREESGGDKDRGRLRRWLRLTKERKSSGEASYPTAR